jgi:hypothetical protein
MTLYIKNGTAELILEDTGTVPRGTKWTFLPAPYNSISPVYSKVANKSSEIKTEGSNLTIRWQGPKLVDWNPKTIPFDIASKHTLALKKASPQVLCILSGKQLIVTSAGTGRSATYNRVQ